MAPDPRHDAEVAHARQVLHDLEVIADQLRDRLSVLLEIVGWTVYPAALTVDRASGDLVRRMIVAVRWALRLEEDVGKEPDVSLAWDDQTPLDDGPAVEAYRITVGRSSPGLHRWTRVLHDAEVAQLVAAVRAVDRDGPEAVERAVRATLPYDVVEVIDRWEMELGPDIWRRLSRNIRGTCRGLPTLLPAD
jgi:hypothetical protein